MTSRPEGDRKLSVFARSGVFGQSAQTFVGNLHFGAVGLAFLAGCGISAQAFVNGRLGTSLGSANFAAVINQSVGVGVLVIVGLATGSLVRAWRRVAAGAGLRWFHVAGNVCGILFVIVASAAAPKVGIALLTVALVSGQIAGGLLCDRLGLSPGGVRDLGPERLKAAALALLAVGIAASAPRAHPHLGLLGLAVVGGMGQSVSQAAVGQVNRVTGEPVAAAAVSFVVAGVAALIVAVAINGSAPPHGWAAAPPVEWLGGVIGAGVVVSIALTVRSLGVFRLTLALVAGQTLGGGPA